MVNKDVNLTSPHNSMTFKDQLEVTLDKYFPKGKSEERGAALVLFAHAVRLHKKEIERVKLLRAEAGSDGKTHVVNIRLNLQQIIEEEKKEFEQRFTPTRSGYTNDGKNFLDAFAHRIIKAAFEACAIKVTDYQKYVGSFSWEFKEGWDECVETRAIKEKEVLATLQP